VTLAELAPLHLETAGEDEAHEHLDAVELDGQSDAHEDAAADRGELDAAGLALPCSWLPVTRPRSSTPPGSPCSWPTTSTPDDAAAGEDADGIAVSSTPLPVSLTPRPRRHRLRRARRVTLPSVRTRPSRKSRLINKNRPRNVAVPCSGRTLQDAGKVIL
jgi:hypothetical protein